MAKRRTRPSFRSFLELEEENSLWTDPSEVNNGKEEEPLDSIRSWVVLDDNTEETSNDGAAESSFDQGTSPTPGSGNEDCNSAEGEEVTLPSGKANETDHCPAGLDRTTQQSMMPKDTDHSSDETLCGYLNKFKMGSRRGRLSKKRWFVFSDASCQLLYYRTPEDLMPLGEIDVSRASFTSDTELRLNRRSAAFKIRSDGQTYCLEAADRLTMMYWLQELQKKRRTYNCKKTTLMKSSQGQTVSASATVSVDHQMNSGLASTILQTSEVVDNSQAADVCPSVAMPSDTVGQTSAGAGNRSRLKDLSFANWRTELRNVIRNLQFRKFERIPVKSPTPSPLSTPNDETSPSTQTADPSAQPTGPMATLKGKLTQLRPKTLGSELEVHAVNRCSSCKQLRYELGCIEDELQATREVGKVLQKQVDLLQTQLRTLDQWQCAEGERREVDMLHAKDKKIVELEHLLCGNQQEVELMKHNASCMEREVRSLQEQLTLYRESTQKKDEMIISISERLLATEGTPQQNMPQTDNISSNEHRPDLNWRELEALRDRCQAYEKQNQFLNSEILELQQLRQYDAAREHQLLVHSTELEAKYYQVKSKYLCMLRQLNNEKQGPEESTYPPDLVCRLLQEAIDMDTEQGLPYAHTSLIGSYPQYDQYGFLLMPQMQSDDDGLLAEVDDLQRKSEELTSLNLDKQISHQVKWENYLVGLGNRDLHRCPELKSLVRGGIPGVHRPKMWRLFIDWWVGKYRDGYGGTYYEKLLKRASTPNSKVNPAFKQIELDLLRTLPSNKHFESMSCSGTNQLRNVLQAYIQHNPNVGYCQGLNRLVAIALLFLKEEDAFWCLVAVAEMIMPAEYYTATLLDAQVDQRVLKDLVMEKIPRLYAHLDKHNVDLSLFTFNWFLTIFVDNIPVDTFLRVWDTFLYEGSKVLFRYALAIFKHREEEILQLSDSMSIQNYLRTIGDHATNIAAIDQIAFQELNPFPMKHIVSRRQVHHLQVKAELDQLNQMRMKRSSQSTIRQFDLQSDDEQITE